MTFFSKTLVGLVLAGLLPCAHAQDIAKLIQEAATPKAQETPASTDSQLSWAQEKLTAARQAEQAFQPEEFEAQLTAAGLPGTRAEDLRDDLQMTASSYAAAVDSLNSVETNRSELEAAREASPPPVPGDDKAVDALREATENTRRELGAVQTQVNLFENSLERQRALQEEAARDVRRAQEVVEAAPADNRAGEQLLLRLAKAREEALSAAVFALSWRLHADELERDRLQVVLDKQVASLRESGLDTVFSPSRAANGLAEAGRLRETVQKQLQEARATAVLQSELVEKFRDNTGANGAMQFSTEAASVAGKIVRGYEIWLGAVQLQERSWQAVATYLENSQTTEDLEKCVQIAEKTISELAPWREFVPKNLRDSRRLLEALEKDAPPRNGAAREQWNRLRELTQARFDQLRAMEDFLSNLLDFEERLLEESLARLAKKDLGAKASRAADQFLDVVARVWNTEVFTTDESFTNADGSTVVRKRGITLGRLLLAVLFAVLAILAAKRFARVFAGNLRRRFSLDTTRGQFLERAVAVVIGAAVILIALNWLHIPLTAFAFLGGALAIGIGFGVQTLMNNFISGLILTAERRIKVGDIIEVEGHQGTVLSLGTRCATIRKFNGVELLVPNSLLLEKNVTNWTMSDNNLRMDFVVGVDYGSDTDKVLKVLWEAVRAQPEILDSPTAGIYFEAFGASSLDFHIYYWLDIRKANGFEVGSSLRLRINRLCEENGIGLAFPQRSVHLHTAEPLKIRQVQPPGEK